MPHAAVALRRFTLDRRGEASSYSRCCSGSILPFSAACQEDSAPNGPAAPLPASSHWEAHKNMHPIHCKSKLLHLR